MTTNHEHLREVADELNAMPFVIPNCKHMASVIYTSLDELAALRKENELLRKLPMEPCPTEAPIHYSNEEAHAWAIGFIDCLSVINALRAAIGDSHE